MLENYGRHLLFPAKTELDPSASGSTAHKQQPAARRGGGKGKVKKGRQREMERGKRAKGEKRRPPAKDTLLTNKPHDHRSPDLECMLSPLITVRVVRVVRVVSCRVVPGVMCNRVRLM
jgi:hypothetical protein